MRIYVASSWRNSHQPSVVQSLRDWGHDVYDFRNPPHGRGGFAWSDIDPQWQQWSIDQWATALRHPLAQDGFTSDFNAMKWADVCVVVLPCGRSAHLEAGWFCGVGKPCAFLGFEPVEPDLMVLLGHSVVSSIDALKAWTEQIGK